MRNIQFLSFITFAFSLILLSNSTKVEPIAELYQITLTTEGQILLGNQEMQLDELEAALGQRTLDRNRYIHVDIDDQASIEVYHGLLRTIKFAEVEGIAWASNEGISSRGTIAFYEPTYSNR